MPSNDFLSPATEFRVGFCTCNFTAFKQKEKRTEGGKKQCISEGGWHQDAGCEQKFHSSLNKALCREHKVLSECVTAPAAKPRRSCPSTQHPSHRVKSDFISAQEHHLSH